MSKKYLVRLTDDERAMLTALITKGKTAAYKIKPANLLLKVEVAGPNWGDEETAEAYSCTLRTLFNVRQRLVEQGLEAALERKKRERPPVQPSLDGEKEARLIQIACSEPPSGHAKWTLKLLADELIQLEVVQNLSPQTVMRTLKKNELKPHLRKCWVIRPEENAEFAAGMEDILEVYQRPYDPKHPVVCLDEQSTQLIGETRHPLPAQLGQPERVDYDRTYAKLRN